MVLTSKARQFLPLSACRPSTRLPASRSACFTQVEIDCAVGSNSRASSSGRASRSHQIDHLSPELRRISGSVAGASDTSKLHRRVRLGAEEADGRDAYWQVAPKRSQPF